MGLIRGMARTAVVAGTATAVSNRVSRRQAERWQQQDYEQQAQYAAPPPAPAPAPAPAAAGTGSDALTAEIERLAALRSQGLLTDEEFAAAKAKVLGL
jgi:Short C-terminal domain